jgi:hypothetical protein
MERGVQSANIPMNSPAAWGDIPRAVRACDWQDGLATDGLMGMTRV